MKTMDPEKEVQSKDKILIFEEKNTLPVSKTDSNFYFVASKNSK
jgi:hypothetical protein